MMPTIQDVIDKAKVYLHQGLSPDEAVRLAIIAKTKDAGKREKSEGGNVLKS